ncbi:MAG: hypothetical protein ACKVOH_01675 [Chlamydiales bacterium]
MKKFVLTVLSVLTCGAIYALPVQNLADASLYSNGFWWGDNGCDPCDPCGSWCDAFSLRLGFYGDYVFNRHLETTVNGRRAGDIQTSTIMTNAGMAVINICDYIDLFGTVGVSNFWIKTPSQVFGFSNVQSELDFAPAMSYSGGLRATAWRCDCFVIGAEAQYFYSGPKLNYYLPYDTGVLTYFNSDTKMSYQEWQVAIGASYIFRNCANFEFVPYGAVQVSGGKWNFSDFSYVVNEVTHQIPNLRPKKIVGFTFGMSAVLCDMIGMTVEGRWANEKAVHVNGQVRF